jgi:hypothetical protein
MVVTRRAVFAPPEPFRWSGGHQTLGTNDELRIGAATCNLKGLNDVRLLSDAGFQAVRRIISGYGTGEQIHLNTGGAVQFFAGPTVSAGANTPRAR